nr:MAG TPA: hypothetical protein [Caudoviricetes sp.]
MRVLLSTDCTPGLFFLDVFPFTLFTDIKKLVCICAETDFQAYNNILFLFF